MAWYDVLQGLGQGLQQAGEISTAQRAQRRQLAREEYESLGEDAEIDAETVRRLVAEGGLAAGAFRRLPSGNYGRSQTLGEKQFAADEKARIAEEGRRRAETIFGEIDEAQLFDPKDEAATLLQKFYPGLLEPTEDRRQLRVRPTAPAIVKRNEERAAAETARKVAQATLNKTEAELQQIRADEKFRTTMQEVLADPEKTAEYQARTSPAQRVFDARRLNIPEYVLLTRDEATAMFEASSEGQAARLRIPPADDPNRIDPNNYVRMIIDVYKALVDAETQDGKPLGPGRAEALRKLAEDIVKGYFDQFRSVNSRLVLPGEQLRTSLPPSDQSQPTYSLPEPQPRTSLPTQQRKLYP